MSTLIEKLERERKTHHDLMLQSPTLQDSAYYNGVTVGFMGAIGVVKQHSDWVSVDDRLPDSDCYVIVYCDGGNVTKSFFTTDREYLRLSRNSRYTRKAYGKNSGYFAISHDDGYKVTHWQPLPQPPSEVQP